MEYVGNLALHPLQIAFIAKHLGNLIRAEYRSISCIISH